MVRLPMFQLQGVASLGSGQTQGGLRGQRERMNYQIGAQIFVGNFRKRRLEASLTATKRCRQPHNENLSAPELPQ